MKLEIYSFGKRRNDSSYPAANFETVYSTDAVTLLEGCSILHPSLQLTLGGAPGPGPRWNYASWNGRYYWIQDWIYDNGFYIVTMDVDPLGSWINQYKQQSFFVLRADSDQWASAQLTDTTYPATSNAEVARRLDADVPLTHTPADVSYVIGVANGDSAGFSAISYYALDGVAFRELCAYLFRDVNWMGISVEELGEGLQKALLNPLQYIASVMMFPFRVAKWSGQGQTGLKLGWWTIPGILVRPISDFSVTFPISIELPKHPQAKKLGVYMNAAPYTEYTLYMPGFDSIPLDPSILMYTDAVDLQLDVDAITGKALIRSTQTEIIGRVYGQLGVPIQLTQQTTDVLGAATGAIRAVAGTVGNLVSLNVGGAIDTAVTGIESAIRNAVPAYSSSGANGSILSVFDYPEIQAKFYQVLETDPVRLGRPVCGAHPLSSFTGFVQCLNPSVKIPALAEEIDAINAALAAGMYIGGAVDA